MAGRKKKDPGSLVGESWWVLPPLERDKGARGKQEAVGRGGKPEEAVTKILLTEQR